MTDAPKLMAYIVALSFADGGPIHCNAVIAPSEVVAVAQVSISFLQKTPTDKPLSGVAAAQLTPEFLRVALRAYEGGVGKPNVFSVVPKDEPVGGYISRAAFTEMSESLGHNQRTDEALREGRRDLYPDPTGPAPPAWQPDDPLDPVA